MTEEEWLKEIRKKPHDAKMAYLETYYEMKQAKLEVVCYYDTIRKMYGIRRKGELEH